MSISFGSTGIKPYVGSKEVQEAYVGDRLVYRAGLPYAYGFLGGADDYMIAEWCQLTHASSITKFQNIYRIAINGYILGRYSRITLSEIKGNVLKFVEASSAYFSGVGHDVVFYNESGDILNTVGLKFTSSNYNEFTLVEIPVPNGTASVEIRGQKASGNVYLYLDALRFETT